MKLTEHLPEGRRSHVELRLRSNLMAWLTTVRPDGQPVSVPVWFLMRHDDTFLVYSQPNKSKLNSIARNPRVALGLDVTDLGHDIIRVDAVARQAKGFPPADQNPDYVAKYMERIGAMFGTVDRFSELFSVPLILTPTRVWA
jgi:PPOX class probable F420-dependent enzyme